MNYKKSFLFLITIIVILLVTSLIVFSIQPGRYKGPPYRFFPKDVTHLFGWISAILLLFSASYSALKRRFPRNIKIWLSIHCIPVFFLLFL